MVYKGLECESSKELRHSGRRECFSMLTPAKYFYCQFCCDGCAHGCPDYRIRREVVSKFGNKRTRLCFSFADIMFNLVFCRCQDFHMLGDTMLTVLSEVLTGSWSAHDKYSCM